MHALNFIVRRIFAWPLVIVGTSFVALGGAMIRGAAWAIDLDVSNI
jgi:hypothetical protein